MTGLQYHTKGDTKRKTRVPNIRVPESRTANTTMKKLVGKLRNLGLRRRMIHTKLPIKPNTGVAILISIRWIQ